MQVSEWRIGVPGAEVPWRSDRFRELATAFIDSFRPRFGSGCLVWHATRGFDGEPPSADDLAALQLVVTFCLLDANDSIDRADPNSGHYLATTENGLLVAQPIDVEQGFITHVGGGLLREVFGDADLARSRSPKPEHGDRRNRSMAITETGHGDRRNRSDRSLRSVGPIA